MSDETDGNIENIEQNSENKVKAKILNKDGRKIELEATQENIDGLREFIDTAKATFEENIKLREEQAKRADTALLNQAQITGQSSLPLDSNDGLPTDMQVFDSELDCINQLERQNTQESKKALNDLLVRSTKGSWAMDFEGNNTKALFKTPKTDKEKEEFAKIRRMWSVSK